MTSFSSRKISGIHRALHTHLPSDPAVRAKSLEGLLIEKRLVSPKTIDAWAKLFRNPGPMRGARVVARAWRGPAFRERLLADANAAIEELGFAADHDLQVVENTSEIHNLIVCTLCSCYPVSLLGMSPAWYKSPEYRARAVRDPRGVLKEFGVEVAGTTEVRVWDSTSERRYLVLPQRPQGTEHLDEAALARLVTRNSMIGTERALRSP